MKEEELKIFSDKYHEKTRAIRKVVDKALNSVHEELDKLSYQPTDHFADMVAEAAANYIFICYDEVMQRVHEQTERVQDETTSDT